MLIQIKLDFIHTSENIKMIPSRKKLKSLLLRFSTLFTMWSGKRPPHARDSRKAKKVYSDIDQVSECNLLQSLELVHH